LHLERVVQPIEQAVERVGQLGEFVARSVERDPPGPFGSVLTASCRSSTRARF
jgi:hypothetical protein